MTATIDDVVAQLRRGACSDAKRHEAPCATCDAVDERIALVLSLRSRLEAAELARDGVVESRAGWVAAATRAELHVTKLAVAARRVLELRYGCGVHEDGSCIEEAHDGLEAAANEARPGVIADAPAGPDLLAALTDERARREAAERDLEAMREELALSVSAWDAASMQGRDGPMLVAERDEARAALAAFEALRILCGTVIADACARLWEADPHSFSTRGCSTCRAVSGLLGRDFGCVAKGKVRT